VALNNVLWRENLLLESLLLGMLVFLLLRGSMLLYRLRLGLLKKYLLLDLLWLRLCVLLMLEGVGRLELLWRVTSVAGSPWVDRSRHSGPGHSSGYRKSRVGQARPLLYDRAGVGRRSLLWVDGWLLGGWGWNGMRGRRGWDWDGLQLWESWLLFS
jgi:hypothetical protein